MGAAGETRRALDHVVMPVSSLADARAMLQGLGFTTAPDAAHPFGTANACIFLADGSYLEPLAIDRKESYRQAVADNPFVSRDAAFRRRSGLPGLSAVALRSSDAKDDRDRLSGLGLAEDRMVAFSREFFEADGRPGELSFSLAFAADADDAVSFFFCQPMHRSAPDRSHLARHANSAAAISGLVLSHPEPARCRERLEAILGVAADESSGGCEFTLSNAKLSVLTPAAIMQEYGISSKDEDLLSFKGVVLRTGPREPAEDRESDMYVNDRLVVPLGDSGCFLAFQRSE